SEGSKGAVIPAQAGIQRLFVLTSLGPRVRGDDDWESRVRLDFSCTAPASTGPLRKLESDPTFLMPSPSPSQPPFPSPQSAPRRGRETSRARTAARSAS